jgi:hypothetical protein
VTEPGSWTPDQDTVDAANLTRFMTWLADTGRGQFTDYHELWSKSVRDIGWYWDAVCSVYGGKRHDRRNELAEIRNQQPTLKATVLVPRLGLEIPIKRILLGAKPSDVFSPSAVDRPELFDLIAEYGRR